MGFDSHLTCPSSLPFNTWQHTASHSWTLAVRGGPGSEWRRGLQMKNTCTSASLITGNDYWGMRFYSFHVFKPLNTVCSLFEYYIPQCSRNDERPKWWKVMHFWSSFLLSAHHCLLLLKSKPHRNPLQLLGKCNCTWSSSRDPPKGKSTKACKPISVTHCCSSLLYKMRNENQFPQHTNISS